MLFDITDLFKNGEIMGKIGDYEFYKDKNGFSEISYDSSSEFGSFKPIRGRAIKIDTGGNSRNISLNGVLVVQPLNALSPLEAIMEERKVIQFTTLDKDVDVLITNLKVVRTNFVEDGNYSVQTYNLNLEEVYEDELA